MGSCKMALVGAALCWGMSLSVSAAAQEVEKVDIGGGTLCKECSQMAFIDAVGQCSKCHVQTPSASFQLCTACARKLGKCQACLAPLAGGPAAPAKEGDKAAPPFLQPIRPIATAPGGAQLPQAPAGLKPGEAVDGLKVSLSADRDSFTVGEKMTLTLTLENVSQKAMRANVWCFGLNKPTWYFTGKGVTQVAQMMELLLAAPTMNDFPELKPGESKSFTAVFQGNPPSMRQGTVQTILSGAGDYTVSALYTGKADSVDGKAVENVWTGSALSNAVKFTVKGEAKPGASLSPEVLETK